MRVLIWVNFKLICLFFLVNLKVLERIFVRIFFILFIFIVIELVGVWFVKFSVILCFCVRFLNSVMIFFRYCGKVILLRFIVSDCCLICWIFNNWLMSFNRWFVLCLIIFWSFFCFVGGIFSFCFLSCWMGFRMSVSGVCNLWEILVKKVSFVFDRFLICFIICFSWLCCIWIFLLCFVKLWFLVFSIVVCFRICDCWVKILLFCCLICLFLLWSFLLVVCKEWFSNFSFCFLVIIWYL